MNTLTMMRYYEGSKKAKAEIKLTRKDNKYYVMGLNPNIEVTENNIGELYVVDMGGAPKENVFDVKGTTNYKLTVDKKHVIYEIKVGDMVKEIKEITPIGNIYGHAWIVREIKNNKAVGKIDYEYNEILNKNIIDFNSAYGVMVQYPHHE